MNRFIYALMACSTAICFAQNRQAPIDFKGKSIIYISDADMVSSAYVDGQLGENDGEDVLGILPLQGDPNEWKAYETYASNSVAGPPSAVAITKDGSYAFVVETFTPPSKGGTSFNDLSVGKQLSVLNIKNTKAPELITQKAIGERPVSVSVHPNGQWVAVGFYSNGESQLGILSFKDGKLGDIRYFSIPHVNKTSPANHVAWHPSGAYLAIVLPDEDQVAFVKVDLSQADPVVTPYGNAVGTGKFPMKGDFTPDGHYFVATCLYWGADIDGIWIEAPKGQLNSIRFETDATKENIRHSNIATVETGISPEGMTISTNGTLIATTNLERSYLPYTKTDADPRITWYSSLSLIQLDPETGKLAHLNDFYFEGILPEAAVFDANDQYLAVAVYDNFEDEKRGGRIDFWRVVQEKGERPFLVQTSKSIQVTRGVHSMVLHQ